MRALLYLPEATSRNSFGFFVNMTDILIEILGLISRGHNGAIQSMTCQTIGRWIMPAATKEKRPKKQ